MNILWCSAYTAPTGYGNQARLFVPRLKALGHKIAVLEVGNSYRTPYELDGVKIIPMHHDPLGNDVVAGYVSQLEIDAVVTLVDVWKFAPAVWSKFPCFPWCPVDHSPVPPAVKDFLEAITRPIAMSKFGADEMRQAGLDPLYLPHAIDPAIFQPQDKGAARHALGFDEDAFIAMFIGVNDSVPSRKGIPELLVAWKFFVRQHPDAKLYLHTLMQGNLPLGATGGVRIDALIKTLDIPQSSIIMPDQQQMRGHIPAAKIARLYAAADVLVQPSRGEGFCVPLIEAQACGTPVIATDFSAQRENVLAGWRVGYEAEWSWQHSFWAKPGIADLTDALEEAYQHRNDSTIRAAAAKSAAQYHIDTVCKQHLEPVLQHIGEDVLAMSAAGVQKRIGA